MYLLPLSFDVIELSPRAADAVGVGWSGAVEWPDDCHRF
jgi:hypothetical protein